MRRCNILTCMQLGGSSPERFYGSKVYISTGAVDCDHIDYSQVEMVDYDNRPSRANLQVMHGDILFAKMCGTQKTLYIDHELSKHLYSTGFFAVRAIESVISPALLYHLLTSEHFLTQKDQNSTGATQKALTNAGLAKIEIQIPDLAEQKAVTDQLNLIDRLIHTRKEQLRLFSELVMARFVELFDDPIHPSQYIPLGEVALLERGRFSPRPRNDPQYYNGIYPFIQTGDIANCDYRLKCFKQTLNEKGIRVSKKFGVGTIVMAIVGATIGATAILEREVYAPDSVVGITVNETLYNNVFLEILLRFWRTELLRIAPESARANINLDILQNIPILQVNKNMQDQFAAFVVQTDQQKLTIQQSLDKLELLKKALMQKYFG